MSDTLYVRMHLYHYQSSTGQEAGNIDTSNTDIFGCHSREHQSNQENKMFFRNSILNSVHLLHT